MNNSAYKQTSGLLDQLRSSGQVQQFRISRDQRVQAQSSRHQAHGVSRSPLSVQDLLDDEHGTSKDSISTSFSDEDFRPSRKGSACARCKRLKKRCDGSFQRCYTCKKAGVSCIPDNKVLQSRIEWLSVFVDSLLPKDISIGSIQTGSDLQSIYKESASPFSQSSTGWALKSKTGVTSHVSNYHGKGTHDEKFLATPGYGHGVEAFTNQGTYYNEADVDTNRLQSTKLDLDCLQDLPGTNPVHLAQAYFDHPHQTDPFLDQNEIIPLAQSVIGQKSLDLSISSARLFLVLAIGCAMLCRAKKVSYDAVTKFQVPYNETIRICLAEKSTESVQVLLLLTIYSTYSTIGRDPYSMMELLSRHALSIDLQIPVSPGSGLSTREIEFRSRLFWSMFGTDKMIAISYGRSFTIQGDSNIMPRPSITINEFTAPTQTKYLSTLQTARHIIALRDIEALVMSSIHLEPEVGDRQHILNQLRVQAGNWYSQGCLLVRMDSHDMPIHNTISWVTLNHQRLLFLLHQPSRYNLEFGFDSAELLNLYHILRQYIHSQVEYLRHAPSSLNHITSNRMLVMFKSLLHCYSCCEASALVELEQVVSECIGMVEAYHPAWETSRLCTILLKRFAFLLKDSTGNFNSFGTDFQESTFTSIVSDLESLMQRSLGLSSVYLYPIGGLRRNQG